jgi:predicted transcriptional regulator
MRKLYKEQKNTLYRLAKETGVSYSTLYNYINGRTQIDSMPFWLVVAIANAEKIDAGVLYEKMIDYNTLKFA